MNSRGTGNGDRQLNRNSHCDYLQRALPLHSVAPPLIRPLRRRASVACPSMCTKVGCCLRLHRVPAVTANGAELFVRISRENFAGVSRVIFSLQYESPLLGASRINEMRSFIWFFSLPPRPCPPWASEKHRRSITVLTKSFARDARPVLLPEQSGFVPRGASTFSHRRPHTGRLVHLGRSEPR